LSLNPVSWFEIGLVKSTRNTTDGIPLHIKRLCVIERMRGTSEGLKTHAYRNCFANMLGGSTDRFRATTSRARMAPQGRLLSSPSKFERRQHTALLTFDSGWPVRVVEQSAAAVR
jgi:hypothetical protein